MPKIYEIENFSLKIILLNQKYWFKRFLKTPNKPAQKGRFIVKKKNFFNRKINDTTVNPSAFNYCHQSKIKMISNPSITL